MNITSDCFILYLLLSCQSHYQQKKQEPLRPKFGFLPHSHTIGMAYAAQGLYECKNAAGAVPDIFRIDFPGIPRTHGQRLPGLPKQLIWFFIHAYHGNCRIIRHFINIQDILHAGYEFRIFFGRDAPAGIFVRSKFIFLAQGVLHPFRLGRSVQHGLFLLTAAESNGNVLPAQGRRPSG